MDVYIYMAVSVSINLSLPIFFIFAFYPRRLKHLTATMKIIIIPKCQDLVITTMEFIF